VVTWVEHFIKFVIVATQRQTQKPLLDLWEKYFNTRLGLMLFNVAFLTTR
jgi:hypothetical protein